MAVLALSFAVVRAYNTYVSVSVHLYRSSTVQSNCAWQRCWKGGGGGGCGQQDAGKGISEGNCG